MHEKTIRNYLDILDDAFIVSETDERGIIIGVNRNFVNISGYSEAELLGSPHNIVRHPSVPKEVFAQMWRTIRSGSPWKGILRNRKKDGGSYVVKTVVAPVFDAHGNIEKYVSFREDLTELFELKEQLHLEKTMLESVLDNSPNIIVVRKNTLPLLTNRRFYEILPFESFDEYLKKHHCICELFVKKEGCFVTDNFDRLAEEKGDKKVCLKDRDGCERYFTLRVKQFDFNDDRYTIFSLNDITEVEAVKEKALEGKRLKEVFLANMAHEIRTPLNAVLGFSSLLEETPLAGKQEEYLRHIRSSSEYLLKIVNEILDFSRLESDRMTVDASKTNVYDLIVSVFFSMKPIADQKGIDLRLKIGKVPECIVVDALKLRQVLTNLMGNAIKFTEEGTVVLRVKKDLTFKVEDSGIGIEKKQLKTIFKPFRQSDASVVSRYGGSGLGLAISRKLLKLMGAKLRVKSEVGKGSVFSFKLPALACAGHGLLDRIGAIAATDKKLVRFFSRFVRVDPDAAVHITAHEETYEVAGTLFEKNTLGRYRIYQHLLYAMQPPTVAPKKRYRGKVLVVDDIDLNRTFIQTVLEELGVEAVSVSGGAEALEAADASFDLVLMDLYMPRMGGIEAAKKIRSRFDLPVVALTAEYGIEQKQDIAAYMQGYLEKPVQMEQLTKILDRYLLE